MRLVFRFTLRSPLYSDSCCDCAQSLNCREQLSAFAFNGLSVGGDREVPASVPSNTTLNGLRPLIRERCKETKAARYSCRARSLRQCCLRLKQQRVQVDS